MMVLSDRTREILRESIFGAKHIRTAEAYLLDDTEEADCNCEELWTRVIPSPFMRMERSRSVGYVDLWNSQGDHQKPPKMKRPAQEEMQSISKDDLRSILGCRE